MIGQSYKAKAQASAWLGAPSVRGAGDESLLSPVQACRRVIGTCWGPTEPGMGALPSSLEVRQPGRLGRSHLLRGAYGSVLVKQKGTAGTPQRKIPHHLIRQNPCPRTAALPKFSQNVLHWSHRNITSCFSLLKARV